MKITPINSTRVAGFKNSNSTNTTGFQKKTNILSAPFSNEGNLTNAGAYGLTCLLTIIPGVEFAQKGFKNASTIGKVGKVMGGIGVMLGLAVPIFSALKGLEILSKYEDKMIDKIRYRKETN